MKLQKKIEAQIRQSKVEFDEMQAREMKLANENKLADMPVIIEPFPKYSIGKNDEISISKK
ncbi:MAG TPA: hypothetical protein PLC80_01325 [Draconibacterium sp.]|nr:hypothetical protein [Draconibacterium sp.]